MDDKGRFGFPWPLLRFWVFRILPYWCCIAFWIFVFQLIVCGIVHDNEKVKLFLQYIDILPSFIKAVIGGEALQVGNIAALIAIGYQEPFILLLYMLYAVGVPTALLSGEIQKGNMELILSRRVTKLHVYTCVGLINVTGMFALVVVMFMGTVVSTNIFHFDQEVPLYSFFKLAINGGVLASAVGGIALLSAACFQRNLAMSLSVAFLVINYIMSVMSEWWPRMAWLSPATIFHYVNGPVIFNNTGWPVRDMCILIAILGVSTIAGGIFWSRRDLPL